MALWGSRLLLSSFGRQSLSSRPSLSSLSYSTYSPLSSLPLSSTLSRNQGFARWSSGTADQKIVTLEDGPDNIAIIRFDDPNSKVNSLGEAFVEQFVAAVDSFEANSSYKALVLISGKKDNFIAGADINQLASCETKEQLQALSRNGKDMLVRLEKSSRPVVAAINGQCLGGGLEVALACHKRVIATGSTMALPEVMLGLLPGAGGTQRLPKLIGTPQALDLMLTGKNVPDKKAKKLGLADLVVDPNALEHSAISMAKDLITKPSKGGKKRDLMTKFLELPVVRSNLMLKKARDSVMKMTRGNYPAPLAIIDCVEQGLAQGEEAGYTTETEKFGDLGMTTQSKALVSLFHAKTACKKNRFGKPEKPVKSLAMIGAGLMGAGIAEVSITKGIEVCLKDRDNKALSRGFSQISKNLEKKVKRKRLASFEMERIMSNLHPVTSDNARSNENLKHVDLVIEAVFEDLKLKQDILSEIEKAVPEHCVIASNTSQIPIGQIAAGLSRPDKVIGMHYFSPVDKMELLEIITTDQTSAETTKIAVDTGLRQGKSVIVVKDGPGFYTTRILAPYMTEFAAMLQSGVNAKQLDSDLQDLGFPVGPVTLIDEVGIDVGAHVSNDLGAAFGQRMAGADTALLDDLVNAGFLGRKSGAGFYMYGGTAKKRELNQEALKLVAKYQTKGAKTPEKFDIQHRMLLRMVNEAVYCLQDGILDSPVDGDFGAVFGLGFPPFLGGPFRWIDTMGADKVVDMMNKYRDELGEQFTPCDLLVEHAKAGKPFHEK